MAFVLKDGMEIVLSTENDNLSNSDMIQVSTVDLWISTKIYIVWWTIVNIY